MQLGELQLVVAQATIRAPQFCIRVAAINLGVQQSVVLRPGTAPPSQLHARGSGPGLSGRTCPHHGSSRLPGGGCRDGPPLIRDVAGVHFGVGGLRGRLRSRVGGAEGAAGRGFGGGTQPIGFARLGLARLPAFVAFAARLGSGLAAQLGDFPGRLHRRLLHEAKEAFLSLQQLVGQQAGRPVPGLPIQRPLAQHVVCRDLHGLCQPAAEEGTVQRAGLGQT